MADSLLGELLDDLLVLVELLEVVHRELVDAQLLGLRMMGAVSQVIQDDRQCVCEEFDDENDHGSSLG